MSNVELNIKELFYEADTRRHQQLVQEQMIACAKKLLECAVVHDQSKFSDVERSHYVEPVWELNAKKVEYESDEYKKLVAQMGDGWKHHLSVNRHHPESVAIISPEFAHDIFSGMDLFDLIEMLCDWIAASKRKGNSPSLPIEAYKEKGLTPQLECILRNTLGRMEALK